MRKSQVEGASSSSSGLVREVPVVNEPSVDTPIVIEPDCDYNIGEDSEEDQEMKDEDVEVERSGKNA